jgi:hypothetical protein
LQIRSLQSKPSIISQTPIKPFEHQKPQTTALRPYLPGGRS